jgi:hypothetical protein
VLSVRSLTMQRTPIEFMRTTTSSHFSASAPFSGRTERHYSILNQGPFADILPLRPGHTLIVPKIHCSRVSELPQEYAAAIGKAISRISKALTKGASESLPNHDLSTYAASLTMLEPVAVDNTALNVVCNQEYAQVVPHVRLAFSLLPYTQSQLPAGSLPYNSCPEVQLTTDRLGSQSPQAGTSSDSRGYAPKGIRVA